MKDVKSVLQLLLYLFWCLKTCMAEAAAADVAGEDQGWWGMGCLGQGATTFVSSPQWHWVQKGRVTAGRQLGSQAGDRYGGPVLENLALLTCQFRNWGKGMAHQTEQAPGPTRCLSWRQVHTHTGALTGFSGVRALLCNFTRAKWHTPQK